jgi:HAD superfamily hydrolase (TIGR01490 family)
MDTPIREKPVIAAFDFDGTITKRDTLISFLSFVAGKRQTAKKLLLSSPQIIGFLLNQVSRQKAKEAVLTRFFKGVPYHQLQEMGEAFAHSPALSRLIYPAALKRLEWHRSQKHRCILISASIDVYLKPWSIQQGFDDLICSTLEVDENGNATGLLEGKNCWGAEKERRLKLLVGSKEDYVLYAYGDSRGDEELLSSADFPFYRKMPSPQNKSV